MIAVDSSVWIDFFAARDTPHTRVLREMLGTHPIVVPDLVLVEVLQGFRDDEMFDLARRLFQPLRIVRVTDAELAVQAARHYRLLRARGITIRKTIDTLIATRCIADGLPLLYDDRDFHPFVEHLGLRSVLDHFGTH